MSVSRPAAFGRSLRRIVSPLVAVAFVVALAGPASAAPPYLRFVQELRDRGFEDMALYDLQKLEADPAVPRDVKDVLDYERALTLLRLARAQSLPEAQVKRLDEATAALEKFVREHPQHPLVARAQTERGRILMGQAEVAIIQADAPGNAKTDELRTQAREAVVKARDIFEQARQRYEQEWKAFGPHVEDPVLRETQKETENALILTRLDLAQTIYREAQTYPAGSSQRQQLLTQAADQFDKIHADYRSQIGGLYARLWEGKSYEEQAPRPEEGKDLAGAAAAEAKKNLGRAEAIYSELLEHDTKGSPAAARMQDLAFRFKLIVRNHPLNADYRLVIDLANEWLKTRTGSAGATPAAIGVRWERAQAAEKLSQRPDVDDAERTRLLRNALSDAEFITAYPGEFKEVSRAMAQRLKAALGRGDQDPQDFDSAYGLAQSLLTERDEKQKAIKDAKTDEQKRYAEQALAEYYDEVARILRLSLDLAGPGVETAQLDRARYLLAFIEYSRGRPYDAAVLGGYVARKEKESNPQIALDAAYATMAAYTSLYNKVPDGQPRDFELSKLVEICTFVATNFPDSDKADYARTNLGTVFNTRKEYAKAAEWYGKVPPASAEYGKAQLSAGQAAWNGYLAALNAPEAERPPQAETDALREQAKKHLTDGLAAAEKDLPADKTPPPEIPAGKLALAQIANLDGRYDDAIKLLTAGPQPVTKLVDFKPGAKRPARGVQSAAFATQTRQQLLRAYIGNQQIEPALGEMKALEQIGGEGNTAIFVQLGRQIKEEIERLPAGSEREKVMGTFDQFLGKLAEMQQGQTYSSLLWIAETYYGLAEAAAGTPKESQYYDRASDAYGKILSKASDAGFLPNADAAAGVKLRLAAVEKSRGEYEKSYDLAREVIRATPKALNAQVETAKILQAWGKSGSPEAPEKLLLAIQGDKSDPAVPVWGWGQIAMLLQRNIDAGQAKPEFQEIYHEARYEIPAVRRAYADTKPDQKARDEELGKAEKELLGYVATTPRDKIGDDWWDKFDTLYQDLQRDRGIAVVKPLEPFKEYVAVPIGPDVVPLVEPPPVEKSPEESPLQASEGSGGWLPILAGLVLAGVLGAGAVVMMLKSGKKKRPAYGAYTPPSGAAPVFPAGLAASAAAKSPPVKPPPTKAAAAAKSPAAAKPAGTPAGATRPVRPKPPAGGAAVGGADQPPPRTRPATPPATGGAPPAGTTPRPTRKPNPPE